MTCREFADVLMDYLSDQMAPEARAEFAYHLGVCANCRKYLSSYEETVKLGKRAFEDDGAALPDEVPEELIRATLAARRAT